MRVCLYEEKLTFLQLLEAFEGDFKFVLVYELGGVVHNIDPQ